MKIETKLTKKYSAWALSKWGYVKNINDTFQMKHPVQSCSWVIKNSLWNVIQIQELQVSQVWYDHYLKLDFWSIQVLDWRILRIVFLLLKNWISLLIRKWCNFWKFQFFRFWVLRYYLTHHTNEMSRFHTLYNTYIYVVATTYMGMYRFHV